MNMTKGPARLGFAAALLALLIAPLAFGVHSAHAQGPTQNIYYGTGLDDGVMIAASIDGALCGETENSASDGWVIYVDEGACDGAAADGATITFTLDGAEAEQTATWSPANSEQLSLTVAAMEGDDGDDGMTNGDDGDDGMTNGDDGDDGDDGMTNGDDGDDGMTDDTGPGLPDDGNAGLVSSNSSSSLLALALGFLAVAGIAGARVATRRVS